MKLYELYSTHFGNDTTGFIVMKFTTELIEVLLQSYALLLYNGQLQQDVLKRERVAEGEVLAALRASGVGAIEDQQVALGQLAQLVAAGRQQRRPRHDPAGLTGSLGVGVHGRGGTGGEHGAGFSDRHLTQPLFRSRGGCFARGRFRCGAFR